MLISGLILGAAMQQATIEPRVGLEIRASGTVRPGVYQLARSESDSNEAVLRVTGDNLTVDFTGVVLRGTPETTEPNQRRGIAVEVKGKNVTIRGLSAHGYMHGLIARESDGLRLLDSDFSYNQKQLLKSGLDKEDTSDWMSYHNNENDQWLRFGTGVYLDRCNDFEIKNVTIVGGQNGLMMTQSNRGLVWNSNFSFLSSVGLGMYRSSDNRIMHNNIDWCVRGYSHGVYNRGQDSTGILIYEQAHRNIFAYNSVTHGGDGFFLWAGQTTMDTGEGGCNDNVLYANDFSHAPTNGIEATFSRNVFANNLLLENWHGVWGGYSYDTKIVGNVFGLNAEGIALEHGQDNLVEGNVFRREVTALKIWANASQDPNWGYPKNRDTRSRDWLIRQNVFFDTSQAVFDVRRTMNMQIVDNFVKNSGEIFKFDEHVSNVTFRGNELWLSPDQREFLVAGINVAENTTSFAENHRPRPPVMQPSGNVIQGLDLDNDAYLARFAEMEWTGMALLTKSDKSAEEMTPEELRQTAAFPYMVAPLEGGNDPFLKPGELRGRRFILVDHWGPYDFQSPVMWPRSKDGEAMRFELLGPEGTWKVKRLSDNVKLSASEGTVPGYLEVTVTEGGNFDVELEYVGGETRDYRGIVTPAGAPVTFGFSEFRAPIDWTVQFWNFDSQTQDPRTHAEAFAALLRTPPVATLKTTELMGSWGGSPAEGVNPDYFTTVAEGTFTMPDGEYILDVTSDDGVRVILDGKVIHEDWTYHAPKSEEIRVTLGGQHRIRVEHFELTGYSTLQVRLRKP